MEPILIIFLVFLWIPCHGMEFYYNIMSQAEACFEEHLGESTLISLYIFYDKGGPISLKAINPAGEELIKTVRIT